MLRGGSEADDVQYVAFHSNSSDPSVQPVLHITYTRPKDSVFELPDAQEAASAVGGAK